MRGKYLSPPPKAVLVKKGWAKPNGLLRWHWFDETGKSLCEKWNYKGPIREMDQRLSKAVSVIVSPNPGECLACFRASRDHIEVPSGWFKPPKTAVYHYFNRGRSLCLNYAYQGPVRDSIPNEYRRCQKCANKEGEKI